MEIPAISVIIPLYNAEKYISDCLNSLLAQTFQDFEVIVVDDCSTDSSVAIVQSFAEKFGGRLKFFKLQKKSAGGGSLPRNKGLELSRGKYIFFLDSDDAITATAFEELYNHAENFKADVIHCEKFYYVPDEIWHDELLRQQLKPDNHFTCGRLNVTEPTPLNDDIAERIKIFAEKKLIWNFWAQLIRRDFIIENEITLPDAVAQDMLFTMCSLCCAKRYVVVPNVINFYRVRENSVTTERIDFSERLRKWLNVIRIDIEYLNEFFSKREELSENHELKYILFNVLLNQMLPGVEPVYLNLPPAALDEILQAEFDKAGNAEFKAVIFSAMNIYLIQTNQLSQRIAELEKIEREDKAYIAALEKLAAKLLAKE